MSASRPRLSTLARKFLGADAWVVGYPKCGNTWFQVMLRRALVGAHGLPDAAIPRVLSDWRPLRLINRVPIGITHHMPLFNTESYRTMALDLSVFRGRKVVLLVRDPRDTLVSLYMQNVYRSGRPVYEGDIDAMVRSEVYGIEKFLKYYRTWYEGRQVPGALMLVRYEDLSRNTRDVLAAALEFLDVPRMSEALLADVVAFSSFQNMKKMESTDALRWSSLRAAPDRPAEGFLVRKGLVGGYVNHLSVETIQYINARMSADLPPFYGYSEAGATPMPQALVS